MVFTHLGCYMVLGWLMLTTFNQVPYNKLQHNKLCK